MPTLFFLGPNAFSITLYHLSLMFLPQKETFQTNLRKRAVNMLPATFVHFCGYSESCSWIYMIHNHCVIQTHTITLYVFFWVFHRRQIVICRRFGTLRQFHLQRLGVVVLYT
jgi:hypothetical protein